MLLLSGCGSQTPTEPISDVADDTAQREVQGLSSCTEELTVWSAYWDCTGDMDVLRQSDGQVQAVSLFAASFVEGQIVLPDATERMLKRLHRGESTKDMKVYLSIVNDVKQNGKTIQKQYTVWYADETTLQTWAEYLTELHDSPVTLSLWRL